MTFFMMISLHCGDRFDRLASSLSFMIICGMYCSLSFRPLDIQLSFHASFSSATCHAYKCGMWFIQTMGNLSPVSSCLMCGSLELSFKSALQPHCCAKCPPRDKRIKTAASGVRVEVDHVIQLVRSP